MTTDKDRLVRVADKIVDAIFENGQPVSKPIYNGIMNVVEEHEAAVRADERERISIGTGNGLEVDAAIAVRQYRRSHPPVTPENKEKAREIVEFLLRHRDSENYIESATKHIAVALDEAGQPDTQKMMRQYCEECKQSASQPVESETPSEDDEKVVETIIDQLNSDCYDVETGQSHITVSAISQLGYNIQSALAKVRGRSELV